MSKKQNQKGGLKKVQKKAKNQSSKLIYQIGIGLALFAALLYSNTLGHDYALDDFSVIKDNYVVQEGFSGIPTIFETHYRYGYRNWNSAGELYRPITLSMFAMEWAIAPDSPFFGHFMNMLLYGLTAFLLFITLTQVLKGYNLLLPLLGTLLFIAHPVHVEVVANIKSRDEILGFLFCLSAMLMLWKHWKNDETKWFLFAIGTYTLAMFSKENAITWLAIFPLVGYFFSNHPLKKVLLNSLAFVLPVLLFLGVRKAILGDFVSSKDVALLDNLLAGDYSWIQEKGTAMLLMGKYFLTMIFPHPLSSDFGYNQIPISDLRDWRVWLSILGHLALLVYAIKNLFKKQFFSFCILFYFINFSIFSNLIITIGSSFGDRFLYVSSLGFCLAMAYLVLYFTKVDLQDKSLSLTDLKAKYALPIYIVLGITVLYSLKTMTRNPVWENSYTLYAADVETAPNSAKLNYHYGLELVKKGIDEKEAAAKKEWMDKAKAQFAKAIEIFPQYHDAYGQLGLSFYREQNFEKAIENYNQAVKYKPNNALVYSNMGIIYFQAGDVDKAQELYEKAVSIDKRFVDAWRNLGSVYAQKQNFPEAIRCYREAIKYKPEDAILNFYLGSALRDSGNPSEAKPYFDRAYELDPGLRK